MLWIDPLQRLWFIWNVMPGEEVCACICEDPDAETLVWGEEFYIGRGIMMNKPIVLTSGEWLFPLAIWKLNIYSEFRKSALREDDVAGSYVYKTSDNGKTFTRLGMADMPNRSFDEHMVIELQNGVLMMLVRTINGIGVCYSYDRGKTWSKGVDSRLGGPCSRFFIYRLRSGRVLLINHTKFTRRNNLTAMLSEDDGKTYPYALMLDERAAVSYPDAMECDDGFIYITYDRDRGCFKHSLQEAYDSAREILTAKITEEDIINGSLVTKGSYLKNVVNKLGRLAEGDPDPYQESAEDIEDFADKLLAEKEDIIEQVFERYPINCVDAACPDAAKLDVLIARFREKGCNDRETLIAIIRTLCRAPIAPTGPNPSIERVREYIEAHMTEDIPFTDIAKKLNISYHYLSHLFKSTTGITPGEFRTELRLTKAKQLLISSDASIQQIAADCGFNNASYFAEVFSKAEKIPPSEYRKYHKEN